MNSFNIDKNLQPKIVHLSFSNDPNLHFEYMREILKNCYGNHSLYTFNNFPKDADLYITEHFLSTKKEINNFLYKNKTINVVHSVNCIPGEGFLCNIALTNSWKNYLIKKGVKGKIEVIPGGVNLSLYKNIVPDFNRKVFGRITRWSSSKIPSWWNRMVLDILSKDKNIKCLMYVEVRSRSRKPLRHKRMIYNTSCKMHHFKGDYLKNIGVYVHANGSFRDIMSNAIIEAMATGLPIVCLNETSTREVIGNAGICVRNKNELKKWILKLLYDKKLRMKYSKLSKERVKKFDVKYTIERYDKLIKEYV